MNAIEFCNQLKSDLLQLYQVPVHVEQDKVLAGSDYKFIVYETMTDSNHIGFAIDMDWYGIRMELDSPDLFVVSSSIYDLWRKRLVENQLVAKWYHEELCKNFGRITYVINGKVIHDCLCGEALASSWYTFNLIYDNETVCTNKNLNIQYESIFPLISMFWGLVLSFSSEEQSAESFHMEGATIEERHKRYERSRINRNACIAIHGYKCEICGFDFEQVYGDIGRSFIEVHHIEPISSFALPKYVDPRNDLIPLCSNCHSIIHRKQPPYTPVEIKEIISNRGMK